MIIMFGDIRKRKKNKTKSRVGISKVTKKKRTC